jgi:hypothetical protein
LTVHLHLARPSLSRPTQRPSRYIPISCSHKEGGLSYWTHCSLKTIFTVHILMKTELFWYRT